MSEIHQIVKQFVSNLAEQKSHNLNWINSAWISSVTVLIALLAYSTRRVPFPKSAPALLSGNLPIVGAWRFFVSRAKFFKDGASGSKTGNFSFYVGSHRVVGMSGLEGRKTFYESKELSLLQGYGVLAMGSPDSEAPDPEDKFTAWFSRTLIKLMSREKLALTLPNLVDDTVFFFEQITASCGTTSGTFDPFEGMTRLIFQLTMRAIGITEIAESQEMQSRSLRLINQIGENGSTSRIVVPWLPTWGYIRHLIASARFMMMVNGISRQRKVTGRRESDALQMLLDDGESVTKIVGWIVLAVAAGKLNSIWNAAWVPCFLALDPDLMREVRAEVDGVVLKHRTSVEQAPLDVLKTMSIHDWERDLPLTKACLNESIRIVTVGAAFRKNVSGRDVPIGRTGEVIPKGGFAALHIDHLHMDPDVYTDPAKFDPRRFLAGREEDKKKPFAYSGWGQGRHPCLGIRFGKLEYVIITAVLLVMYDFELCDAHGVAVTTRPDIDREKHGAGAPGVTLNLKCTQRRN